MKVFPRKINAILYMLSLPFAVREAIVLRRCSTVESVSRRKALLTVVLLESTLSLRTEDAQAFPHLVVCNVQLSQHEETPWNRPFAPAEALVPATVQRSLLVAALSLATQWSENNSNNTEFTDQLKAILDEPSLVYRQKNAISMTRRYPNNEKARPLVRTTPKLSGTALRAALNVYTANLRFGDSYLLTASAKDKKELVRANDGLPDVRQVITSDLDLRDLYRNRIQTLIEDAQAELWRRDVDGPDVLELRSLLQEASSTLDNWFALISENDIQEAERLLVRSETLDD